MDNKIEHFFVLKPDGKIGWIEKMPKEPIKRESFESYAGTVYMGGDFGYEKAHAKYQQALQSAIDNAVEVSNFDETEDALLDAHATGHGFRLEVGKVYSLQCSVEKKSTSMIKYFIENKETKLWWYEQENPSKPNYINTFNGGRLRGIGFQTDEFWTNDPNDKRIHYDTIKEAQKMIETRVGLYPDSVEVKEHEFINPLALVTFSQPEREETQEEDLETAHWVRIINDSRFYDGSPHDLINLIAHFKKLGFTLTRKTP